jgi:hypothetical protein
LLNCSRNKNMESPSFRHREEGAALRQQDENQTSNECPGRDPHVRPNNVSLKNARAGGIAANAPPLG